MAYESSQGIDFKFNNAVYTATSLSVTKGSGEFNVTSVSVKTGANCISIYRPGSLKSIEIKADFIGNTLPPQDNTYVLEIGGSNGQAMLDGSSQYTATCTSCQITAQAGELIKGSATFKLSYD